MPPIEDRAHYEALLQQYRRNVQILEQQAASFGGEARSPLSLVNDLENARAQEAETESKLNYIKSKINSDKSTFHLDKKLRISSRRRVYRLAIVAATIIMVMVISGILILNRLKTNIANQSGSYDFYVRQGLQQKDKGEFDNAIASFSTAISFDSEKSAVYMWRSLTYYAQGTMDLAVKDCDTALSLDHEGSGIYFNCGIVYAANNDYKKALPLFDDYINMEPSDPNAHYERGYIYSTSLVL